MQLPQSAQVNEIRLPRLLRENLKKERSSCKGKTIQSSSIMSTITSILTRMICQLYPSFVSNFKSKTQKMAQEPYFENSDQFCKSNNTLKNCTNIFGNNLLPNWLCLLLIPSYFPSLLESQSLTTMPQKRKTKNWEATLDIKKEMQRKIEREYDGFFQPISRKINMPLVSQIYGSR